MLYNDEYLKTRFIIDGDPYLALFPTLEELSNFIDDTEADGSEIIVDEINIITWREAYKDPGFEDCYVLEVLCSKMFPEFHFESQEKLEEFMKSTLRCLD